MPYIQPQNGVRWVCWKCLSGRCSLCVNTRVRAPIQELVVCPCTHPALPVWLLTDPHDEMLSQPVTREDADGHRDNTGPFPVIQGERPYASPWYRRRAS